MPPEVLLDTIADVVPLADDERARLLRDMAGYAPGHGVREMAYAEYPEILTAVASADAARTWLALRDRLPRCSPFGYRPLAQGAALIVAGARLAFPDLGYEDAARAWTDRSVDVMLERSVVLRPLLIACDGHFDRFVKVNHDAGQHWLNYGEAHIVELKQGRACIEHLRHYASFARLSHLGFYAGMMRHFGVEGRAELDETDEHCFDLVVRWG